MVRVSIVIINHNYANFVAQAIESALRQTEPAAEIVVVDDGSVDQSMTVINRFRDRVIVIEKEQGGHVSAANAGFECTTGDLCIFLDADDFLYPDCTSEVAAAWEPGLSKIQYRLNTIDRAGVDQEMPFPHFPASLTPESVRRQSFSTGVYPWTVSSGCAFARSYLSQLMPIDATRIFRSPDGYLSKLAPLYGDVRSLPEILGAYRVHGSNAWAMTGGSMSMGTIIRSLQLDRVVEPAFIEQAAKLGVHLHAPLLPAFHQLEYRALACRFAPDQTPYRGDTRFGLIWLSLRMTMHAHGIAVSERIARPCWLVVIVVAPKPFIETLFGRVRGQIGRTEMAKKFIAWARRQRFGDGAPRVRPTGESRGLARTPRHDQAIAATRIAVIIATINRPNEVSQLLRRLEDQTHLPSHIVLSVEKEDDLPVPRPEGVAVVYGPRGLTAQRNRGMEHVLRDSDVIIFFDDDYLPSRYALEGVARFFSVHADVVGATGRLLADGIGDGGISETTALRALAEFDDNPHRGTIIRRELLGAYGCNMAFRSSAIGDIRFDERLPLYGWQEDVDFAARLTSNGRIVQTDAFTGIHRGITRGRVSGVRLGYSQIANPIYLVRKGTMRPKHAASLILRNLLANHIRMFWPESWVDRKGRVRGNWLGIGDVISGKMDPGEILRLK